MTIKDLEGKERKRGRERDSRWKKGGRERRGIRVNDLKKNKNKKEKRKRKRGKNERKRKNKNMTPFNF